MKKLLAILILLIIVATFCVYIFIPKELFILGVVGVKSSYTAVNRVLPNKKTWEKCWPGTVTRDSLFNYKNTTYKIGQQFLDGQQIAIESKSNEIKSKLIAIKIDTDSSLLQWRCSIVSGPNPFSRISNYLLAKKIKTSLDSILVSIKPFFENKKNIYGFTVQQVSIADTVLTCTKKIYTGYPRTENANMLIEKLKDYIQKQKAHQTGKPMMNVSKTDSGFQMMVAIPTDKKLKNQEEFFFRRMVPGQFLSAEGTGGEFTIGEMMHQMELYIQDYQRTPMAIPFQVFITDRSIVKDTSRWITKIYFPIF